MTPREQFLQMKIEHYADRAEEYRAMARYPAARHIMDTALSIEGDHAATLLLRDRIETEFSQLLGGAGGGDQARAQRLRRGDLVVVVDQDERVLMEAGGGLRRNGFRYASAATYDEAIELLTLVTPDIIISEVNFDTGSRGFDLFLWARTHSALVSVPFLFQATRINRDVMLAGRRFGVDDFLVKPVDGELLAAAAAQALHRRRAVPLAV